MHQLRITGPIERVLAAILYSPDQGAYGYDLVRASGVRSGSLYPILARLEQAGFIEGHWEQPDPGNDDRPPRRRYQLTTDGRQLVEAVQADRTRIWRRAISPDPGLGAA